MTRAFKERKERKIQNIYIYIYIFVTYLPKNIGRTTNVEGPKLIKSHIPPIFLGGGEDKFRDGVRI